MKKLIPTLLLFAGFCLTNAYAQNSQKILVTIGNEPISAEEFISTYGKNNNFDTATPEDLREYLDLFINFKMKVKEGEALQLDTSRQFKGELLSYKRQSGQQYLIDKEVTEALMQEAETRAQRNIRASHILINCAENASSKDTAAAYTKIMGIRDEIVNGKLNFADAAVKYSEDPSARDMTNPQSGRRHYGNKGDLGYFSVFDLIYPFENAAYQTPVGSVSMPVRTRFGYHLIYVTDDIAAIKEIAIAQIFIADTLARLGQQSATTVQKLADIRRALSTGASFGEVVKQYSEDRVVDNGGVQEPFAPNRRQGDFVKAICALSPDQISQPIASLNGWHIVKLIEIVPLVVDEDTRYSFRERISRDERSHKSKDSFIAKLKKEYNYNEAGRKKAIKFFLKNMPAEFFQTQDRALDKCPGIEKLKPMATYSDQQITAAEFAKYFSRLRGQNLQPNEFADFLNNRFDIFLQDKLTRYERDRLEEKYPEFKALVQEFHDGMILYEINTQKVWGEAMKDSVGLEKFYHENKEKYIDPGTAEPSPLNDIRALVITDYQEFLDKKWIAELREKYQPAVNEDVWESLLKR